VRALAATTSSAQTHGGRWSRRRTSHSVWRGSSTPCGS
jgi:hypothetical protein